MRTIGRWAGGDGLLGAGPTPEGLAHLLDAVEAGEEIVVTRRGRAAARIVPVPEAVPPFPDRTALRASLPPMTTSAVDLVRQLRDEDRG